MQIQAERTFEWILEDNKDKIYRICRIYAVSPIEPEDLFQEVVYQIWKAFSAFKGNSSISTWVYRIALNVCIRSKKKLEKDNGKIVQFESIQFVLTTKTTDKSEEERYKALHDCISSLDESYQSIVILHLEELPYKEIAMITGLTENHVAVKMKRIRNLLFDCITSKLK